MRRWQIAKRQFSAKLRMHQTQLLWADWRQLDVIAELSFLLEHESSPAVLLRFAQPSRSGFWEIALVKSASCQLDG